MRGQAMQKAVPVGVGAMAALIGLEFDAAAAVAAEAAQGQVCQAANDNGGGQVVVSGDKAAVERAVEIAKTKGAKRAMMLPVSAPFHCALMQPAADVMAQALAQVTVKPPVVPVVANVLAKPISEPAEIVRALVAQVTGTVRWRESVAFMAGAGVTTIFYEVGAGKVLSGLIKRIADGASASAVGSPEDVAAFKAAGRRTNHVRSDGQDRAGDRRHRRHRRGDRARAAWPGRHRRDFRHAARGARCARRRTEGSRARAALRSRRQGCGRGPGAERGRRWRSSTSWSPMPA